MKNRMMRNRGMNDRGNVNWVLWGSVIAAAAAGVIFYLYNKDEVNDRLGDLRDKATDAIGRARTKVRQQVDDVSSQM